MFTVFILVSNTLRIDVLDASYSHNVTSDTMIVMTRNPDHHLTEGDVNSSLLRQQFIDRHIGSVSKTALDKDAAVFLHQALSTPCLNVIDSARGAYLTDRAGRRILDFHGNSVHQVGYGHPKVVDAIKRQLDQLPFCPRRYTNDAAIELASRLSQLAPVRTNGENARVLFAPGGAAAIGIALKLVRYATGRFKTISMWDAFHGASLDAISIGGEALFREGVGPLLPGCLHVPPYSEEGVGKASADYVDYVLQKERDVAAVIAEPMRWTTVVPPPQDYWQRIRSSCDRHGALLVIDEIPACLGRTGAMFCSEHFGIEPDILVIGKGLGGGIFPMAALIARGDLNVAADRALGHYTHEKSSVGSAAALATLDVIEEEKLIQRAAHLGTRALEKLHDALGDMALVHQIRGLGLQLAIELRRNGHPANEDAEAVLYHSLELGLSYKVSDGNVLSLGPSLTIADTELDFAIDVLRTAIGSRP